MQHSTFTISRRNLTPFVLLLMLVFILGGLFAWVFSQLPITGTALALDWNNIYHGINRGDLIYYTTQDGLRNPPWSIIPLIPLTWLPFQAGWGVLTLATLGTLITAIPRARKYHQLWLLIVLLLATSHAALRVFADGNVEGLVIAGVLLMLYGFRNQSPLWLTIGLLCASAKPQEIWLLFLVIPFFLLRGWKREKVIRVALYTGASLALVGLWRGREWWAALTQYQQYGQGTPVDISWLSVSTQLQLPGWLFIGVWLAIFLISLGVTGVVLRRQMGLPGSLAGFLVSASLILSSYAAGNVVLTVLALAIVPLYVRSRGGLITVLIMIAINDLGYLLPVEFQQQYAMYYALLFVFAGWVIAGVATLRQSAS